MSSTKIINVLKNDQFDELLDIVKTTDASEVIFVLPKTAKSFRSEDQFATLDDEIKRNNKSAAFLCSNPKTNELAKKYNFDVLSPKTGSLIAVSVSAKNYDTDDSEEIIEGNDLENEELEDQGIKDDKKTDHEEEGEAEPEDTENKPPYGTELDDEGNVVYEDEEGVGEQISSANNLNGFQITTTSAKTRGLKDIIEPSSGKNLRVTQKDRRSIKIETKKTEDDIQSVWGAEKSENIWSDISDSITKKTKTPFLSNLWPFKKTFNPKKRLKFGTKNFFKSNSRIYISILSVVVVFGVAFMAYLTIGKAKVEIRPRSEELNFQLKITISSNFSSVDESLNRIPGQLFTINKSESETFNSTSEKDAVQKSRGMITIYNEYSTSFQPLVATTRFEYINNEKESGFIFRTLKTVTVPGMTVENGIVTPGKINVEVIADKAGQDYNVPAGRFGIVAWREKGDGARYEKIYGNSSDAMHGGIVGKAKVVSEFDYNNAKDQLTKRITNEINKMLEEQSVGLELLNSIKPTIDSVKSTAGIDDAADTFTLTVNGSIATVGFNKGDLMFLLSQYVDKTKGLIIIPERLELAYKNTVADISKNTFEVMVNIEGKAYAKIDKMNVAASLAGKDEIQMKDYLGSVQDIDSAKVVLSPFWVKRVPKKQEKIDISLIY